MTIAKNVMDWVTKLYGSEFAELRRTVWEKGFQGGHAASEHRLSAEAVEWLDKAIDQYYHSRIYAALANAGKQDDADVLREWSAVLQEMCGNSDVLRKEITEAALKDKNINQAARQLISK
jgi:hypothetical protein